MSIAEAAMSKAGTTPNVCPTCKQTMRRVRSEPDHRRFFALIEAAYQNWRDDHDFQPANREHLRAWLLCKARYTDVVTIPIEGDHPAVHRLAILAAEGAIKAAKTHAFLRPHGSAIAVFTPKSIAWDKLSQSEFAPIRSAVEEIIEAEIGVDCDTLLKGHERAA